MFSLPCVLIISDPTQHATESLRSNINNFFDNTLQPSAARDSELGVTSRHKQPIDPAAPGAQGHGPAPGKAMGTGSGASSTGTGSTGMSGDAKNLGQSIKESLGGNK